MTTAVQVARHLIHLAGNELQTGPMTNLKLQKLLYYAQMEALVDLNRPLFDDPIMAWIHGPVVEPVYDLMAPYEDMPINPEKEAQATGIPGEDVAAINAAWEKYKLYTAGELVDKTHRETPWLKARGDLGPREMSRNIITPESIKEYGLKPRKKYSTNLPKEVPIHSAVIDKLTAYSDGLAPQFRPSKL